MSSRVSFITFTRNSSSDIRSLLEHIHELVDEIIVIDGFSEDSTTDIARSYGAKVFLRKPWGFLEPDRMFALNRATCTWILHLDCDERLGREFKENLRNLLEKAERENISAYSSLRVYLTTNKKPILGNFYNRQIRLYRREGVQYRGIIHELPRVSGRIFNLPDNFYILHMSNLSTKTYVGYAYLERVLNLRIETGSSKKKLLWAFAPFSTLAIFVYYILDSTKKKLLNLETFPYLFHLALYEGITQTLFRSRTKKQKKLAQIISEKGLIRLLNLDK